MTRNEEFLFVKTLRACPEGEEGRDQQPEQSLHEEEEKAPEAESFDPLSYAHSSDSPIRIAPILTKPHGFGLPLRLSVVRQHSKVTVKYLPLKETFC